MKTRWNTRRLVPVALLAMLALTCGTVFAYMFSKAPGVAVQFTPAQVSCTVEETFESNVKSNITVKNTSNIPAYLRVRLVTYWVVAEGEDAGKVAAKKSDYDALAVSLNDGWIAGSNNTYYYELPVAPDTTTQTSLFSGSIPLKAEDGFNQVVDVFAEAIQADPTKAVEDSWKVTIDADGKITAAP